jgi:hypoxanthine-DNA glycosylase
MTESASRSARVRSFAPVADANARVLVLGSMPGKASLAACEYYAHPRNQFWPIMCELTGAGPELAYAERTHALRHAGIALWDVLKSCQRASSLDSDIERDSLIANDFAAFFAGHPRIERVYFNGTTAESCYRRLVCPLVADIPLAYTRLPSTSPAHAGMSFIRKLAAWRCIVKATRTSRQEPLTKVSFRAKRKIAQRLDGM